MFSFGSSAFSLPPKTAKAVCQRMPLTPERIPSFIIPSPRARHRPHEDVDRTRLLSTPDHCASPHSRELSPSFSLFRRSPRFSKLSPASAGRGRRADRPALEDRSDLSTRAALSLEHVKKISTPYGFRTLAESPHVRRRESLFHGDNAKAASNQPSTASPCVGVRTPLNVRRENSARLPSDSEQVTNPSEGQQENSVKCPGPNGVLKAAKDGLHMVLKKTRNALRTPTPRRRKGPSSIVDG